ncbi:MAG: site-2 protease family protein [Planctomycetota bacterium]
MSQFIYYLAIAVALGLVIYSIILHEIAHAYAANLMGDPTAAMLGRLTLNPIKHIDPFSTILVPMMTYIYMGFIFGGAKPVPINPYNFRNRAKGMMLSGIAGPAVNLVIMLVFGLLHRLFLLTHGVVSDALVAIVGLVGWLNMVLLVFNMLPVPPLDGSRVVSYFLPPDLRQSYNSLERYGLFIVLAMFLLFRPQLGTLFYYVRIAYDFIAG